MNGSNKETPEQELEGILGTFGSEYEWPYRFMKDLNRTPADQQVEAQKLLIRETATKLTDLFATHYKAREAEIKKRVEKRYLKEIQYLRAFQETVVKRETVKIEPIKLCAGCSVELSKDSKS